MVYIYKKITGSKEYYYLRVSERKGNRIITKDISYLGNSIIDVRKKLDNLKIYKEQIRKSYKILNRFLECNYYLEEIRKLKLKKNSFLKEKTNEIEACKLHFNKIFMKSHYLTQQDILKNYVVEFAYNTTSIEGNTINLEDARNFLNEGSTPKNKTLREIYDLRNTEKVFFYLWENRNDIEINHETIIKIHDDLLNEIDSRKGYRIGDVRVIRSNFDATPGKYVKTDMDLILKWLSENEENIHPVALALIFHHKFEKIHPFFDGNGRTGRMIMNLILIKKGYPPTIIYNKNRKEYLDALGFSDKLELLSVDSSYRKLIDFGIDEFTESYWNLFL